MKLVEPGGAQITAQRSMEALRNGVPNTNAVRALGCTQPRATESFTNQLDLKALLCDWYAATRIKTTQWYDFL